MGSNAGSMLVAPTADGSRPGYGWLDTITKIGQTIMPGGDPGYVDLYGGGKKSSSEDPGFLKKLGQTIMPGGETGYADLYGWLGGEAKAGEPTGMPQGSPGQINKLPVEYDDYNFPGIGDVTQGMPQYDDYNFPGIGDKTTKSDEKTTTPGNPLWEFLKKTGQTLMPGGDPGFLDLYAGTGKEGTDPSIFRQAANIAVPLGIGKWAHDYQKDWLAKQPKSIPDTSGIDIADIRRRAKIGSDPGLHFLPPPEATEAYGAAQGGRIGYADGSSPFQAWASSEGINLDTLNANEFNAVVQHWNSLENKAQGGRIGYKHGGAHWYNPSTWFGGTTIRNKPEYEKKVKESQKRQKELLEEIESQAYGGRVGAQEGGLMNLGGMEKDYRQEGGFVPIGGQERADDVPARLSKNEFVFTADAVRAAGGGDIDAGAEVMENLMNNLERGGQVSEESQGLEGARDMFATAQRLEGVL